MRAVVIVFDGAEPSSHTLACIAKVFEDHGYDGKINIVSLNGTEIANAIVQTQRPHFVSTEEGDNAVIAFRTMVPAHPCSLEFIMDTVKHLTAGQKGETLEDEAFLRAASLISQKVPVSKEIADKYHYNDTVRKKVSELYNKFMSN